MNFKRLNPSDYDKLDDFSDSKTMNRNHIIFGFYEIEGQPDEITEALNLKPTRTGLKGDEFEVGGQKKIKKIRDYSFWEIESITITNDFIGDLVDKFADEVIKNRRKEIRALSNNCVCKLAVVQYYRDGWNPGYLFSRDLVKLLADINAKIDIDVYCLSEDTRR